MHIFILGHSNELDGRLSPASESRISLAISILEDTPTKNGPAYLVATGGFGDNFNTSRNPHRVWVEDEIKRLGRSSNLRSGRSLQSAHTVEDAILIKNYCEANDVASFLVVTNAFHLARTKLVFDAVFNPIAVNVLAAADPENIGDSEFAHETDAIGRLRTQGGVLWDVKPIRSSLRPGR